MRLRLCSSTAYSRVAGSSTSVDGVDAYGFAWACVNDKAIASVGSVAGVGASDVWTDSVCRNNSNKSISCIHVNGNGVDCVGVKGPADDSNLVGVDALSNF